MKKSHKILLGVVLPAVAFVGVVVSWFIHHMNSWYVSHVVNGNVISGEKMPAVIVCYPIITILLVAVWGFLVWLLFIRKRDK